MPTNHRSIQDNTTTLPQPNGDRDFEKEFDAPGLNGDTRPFLSYRVNPADDSGVRLQMELNGIEIVDQTIDTTVSRTFNEVFDEGVLRESGNTLRVFVPNDEPGSLEISDLIMVYPADA
jgi:hypothetical protein